MPPLASIGAEHGFGYGFVAEDERGDSVLLVFFEQPLHPGNLLIGDVEAIPVAARSVGAHADEMHAADHSIVVQRDAAVGRKALVHCAVRFLTVVVARPLVVVAADEGEIGIELEIGGVDDGAQRIVFFLLAAIGDVAVDDDGVRAPLEPGDLGKRICQAALTVNAASAQVRVANEHEHGERFRLRIGFGGRIQLGLGRIGARCLGIIGCFRL